MNTNIKINHEPLNGNSMATQQNNEFLTTPFIHLPTQHLIYKRFQENYNAEIRAKRKPIEHERDLLRKKLEFADKYPASEVKAFKARLKQLRAQLSTEPYQTLKRTHMALMIEITRRIIKQQRVYNNTLAECGGNRVEPGKDYTVFTNNGELAWQMLSHNKRSVYDQRKRLATVGFIVGTDHHQGLMDFGSVINGSFLAFYNDADKQYKPHWDDLHPLVKKMPAGTSWMIKKPAKKEEDKSVLGQWLADQKAKNTKLAETKTSGLQAPTSEVFAANDKLKELFNTSIMSVKGVSSGNNLHSLPAEKVPFEKGQEKLRTVPIEGGKAEVLPTKAVSIFEAEKKAKNGGRAALIKWRNEQTNTKNYKLATIYTLFKLAEKSIYPGISINWKLWVRCAEHVYEKWYLTLPDDRELINQTFLTHLKAIARQKSFLDDRAQKGETAFTKLPDDYFAFQTDVMIQCKQRNFSTFHSQLIRNEAENKQKQARELGKIRYRYKAFYAKQTAKFWTNPTLKNFHQCVRQLQEKHPHIGEEMATKFKKEVVAKNQIALTV